jgi:hypothetical protein
MATPDLIADILEAVAIAGYFWPLVALNLIAVVGILEDGGERLIITN